MVFGVTVPLLQAPFELVLLAGNDVEVFVSELAHCSFALPFISFQLPSTRFQSIAKSPLLDSRGMAGDSTTSFLRHIQTC